MPIHPLAAPIRVYDSRAPFNGVTPAGPIRGGESRLVNIGVGTELFFIAASGAMVNVTIVSRSGSGFLTIRPPASTPPATSTINWTGPGEISANLAVTQLREGNLEIVCGGSDAATDFVIDVLALLG